MCTVGKALCTVRKALMALKAESEAAKETTREQANTANTHLLLEVARCRLSRGLTNELPQLARLRKLRVKPVELGRGGGARHLDLRDREKLQL